MAYNYSQKLHNSCCNYCRFIDPHDTGIDEMGCLFRCYCKARNAYVPIYTSSNSGCYSFVYYPLSNAYGFDESETVDDFKRCLETRRRLKREVMLETWKIFNQLSKDGYSNELFE